MIKYALICTHDHEFEGWFAASDDYEAQCAAGLLRCPVCDSADVNKAIMAPNIATGRKREAAAADLAARIQAARSHIAENYTYVGGRFADEVRDIHAGLAEQRLIYGETTPEEAKALREEGIPVAPLPPILSPQQPKLH